MYEGGIISVKSDNTRKTRTYLSLVSFAGSAIAMMLIFALSGLLFGKETIFRGDMFQQYIAFISSFVESLKDGGSFWYSFSNYLGSGNILTNSYYCISPFNVLFLLCGDNYQLAFLLVIILKMALASFSFCYFVCSFRKNTRPYYVIASMFYGISGFSVAMYFDVMWLDVIYILPILILLIMRFIDEGKYLLLVLVYSYMFITNFYMAYMAGIYSALFFVLYLSCNIDALNKDNFAKAVRKCMGFFGIVVLAAGICAFIMLSTLGFMSAHMAQDNFEFESLQSSILDFVNALYVGEYLSINNEAPLLYCGLPVMGLLFYFFYKKDDEVKNKVLWGGQILFLVLAMSLLPLYKFMHAFDFPNSYGYRFSFCLIFVLLTISCIAIDELKEDSLKFMRVFSGVAILFYSFMMAYQKISFGSCRLNSQSGLVINGVLIIAWAVLLFQYFKVGENFKKKLAVIAIALGFAELVINGTIIVKNLEHISVDANLFNEWYYAEKEAVGNIKANDDGFYRVYSNNEVCMNSGKMFGYNSISTFSSADNYNLRMTLSKLGMSTCNRMITSHCLLPVFDSLFGVKYSIDIPKYDEWKNVAIDKENYLKAGISENEYALSLGYMVSNLVYAFEFQDNSFVNLENLSSLMIGEKCEVFEDVALSDSVVELTNYQMDINNDKYLFSPVSSQADTSQVVIAVEDDADDIYLEVYQEEPVLYEALPVVSTREQGFINYNQVSVGGAYKIGGSGFDYAVAVLQPERGVDFTIDRINIAKYNSDEFGKVYAELSKNQYNIIENRGHYIAGTVVATEEKPVLFTTIPYDPEWRVYVDGKISPMNLTLDNAFISVMLTPGEHVVTFEYVEKYSAEGMVISFVSILIYMMLIIVSILRSKKDN